MITTLPEARTAIQSQSPTNSYPPSPRPQPRALIVAGDPFTDRPLSAHLARGGFATEIVSAGGPVLAEVRLKRPHVIFLCLGARDSAALSVCEEIRRSISTPIIVCSASHELPQLVEALQAGADDYFVLPMPTAELVARVCAVLRRVRRSNTSSQPQDRIVAGDLEVRPRDHRAYRKGEPVDLSPTEFRLLTALVSDAGHTVSHRNLLANVWGSDYTDNGASLRIYIGRLRSKLGNDALITSTRGLGYRLQPAAAVASPAA